MGEDKKNFASQNGEYDAFISYRRSDGSDAARLIRTRLQRYKLPKTLRHGRHSKLRVFLDTMYERGSNDFYQNTIRPALLASNWLVIVATPDAAERKRGDDWIVREIEEFSATPQGKNVVIVRAKGSLNDELPGELRQRHPNVQIIDFREFEIPWRWGPWTSLRLQDELLKVAAPLLIASRHVVSTAE